MIQQTSHITSQQHSTVYRETHFVSSSPFCTTIVDHPTTRPHSMARRLLTSQRPRTCPFLSLALNIIVKTSLLSLQQQLPDNIATDGSTRVPARLMGPCQFMRCKHRAQMYNCIQTIRQANHWNHGYPISSTLHCNSKIRMHCPLYCHPSQYPVEFLLKCYAAFNVKVSLLLAITFLGTLTACLQCSFTLLNNTVESSCVDPCRAEFCRTVMTPSHHGHVPRVFPIT